MKPFLSFGTIPPNPWELLVHDNFSRLIEQVSEDYDMIIFDTPPMLKDHFVILSEMKNLVFLISRSDASLRSA